jgi:hypothetical protein
MRGRAEPCLCGDPECPRCYPGHHPRRERGRFGGRFDPDDPPEPASDDNPPELCEYCGEPGTEENPLQDTVISPPVDGYRVESMLCHRDCGNSAAIDLVI